MATTVIMPKLGNSVESTIIVAWKKAVGDTVAEDDILCEVETDKAVMEVPSTVSGTLLAILHEANEEVPVLANIAVIGAPGDDISQWTASAAPSPRAPADSVPAAPAQPVAGAAAATLPAAAGDDAGAMQERFGEGGLSDTAVAHQGHVADRRRRSLVHLDLLRWSGP